MHVLYLSWDKNYTLALRNATELRQKLIARDPAFFIFLASRCRCSGTITRDSPLLLSPERKKRCVRGVKMPRSIKLMCKKGTPNIYLSTVWWWVEKPQSHLTMLKKVCIYYLYLGLMSQWARKCGKKSILAGQCWMHCLPQRLKSTVF